MKNIKITLAFVLLLLAGACKKDEEQPVKKYALITESSTAHWKGFLRTGYFNEGTLSVSCENIQVANGVVRSGTFKMPLSTLKNLNLPTEELKIQLIHHLQSPDFFNMVLYPSLTFRISKVENYSGSGPDAIAGANYSVTGDLTMLGQPHSISFPARITTEGKEIKIDAFVKVDRTAWGMNYAADPTLPDSLHILPKMEIELNLKANRQ